MELPSMMMSVAVALVAAFFIILVLSGLCPVVRLRRREKPLKLPPGPRGWPLVGCLGLLAGAPLPHRALAALASRHGPLMHLRLGSFHTVVASSAETARLVLKTHDHAFADRPPTAFGRIMAYGFKGILQTPYGAYWRTARKLCATELFSARRIDSFEQVRAQELRALTRGVFERAGTAVQVRERLANLAMRNVLRMLAGDKWSRCCGGEEGEAFLRNVEEAFAVSHSVNSVGEWLPWLGWLDAQGFIRRMKRVHEVFDRFFEKVLNEHERDRQPPAAGTGAGHFTARDLVDVLLELVEEGDRLGETEARLTRDSVKAFIHDIILGGTETTSVTVEWAMAELLRHPDAMAAATEELDRVVGCQRWVTETDLPDLPYVNAVVKETMRLHPAGPVLFPHRAREDTVVGGYDIPAGARVLVNVWAVARDPASWPDEPDAFRPERFLADGSAQGIDVRGAHFKLLPFGSGRRTCPAYNLAIKQVAATLANLLHGFTWRLPDGVALKDVIMDEFFGLSMKLKVPLVAVAEARLPAHLYAAVG